MKSRVLTIRLYPEREADRTALEWLERKETAGFQSNNAAVVTAINDYFSRFQEREKEDAFLERVLETVREGMREAGAANIGWLASALQNAVTPPSDDNEREKRVDEESLDAALEFVDSL